MITYGSLFSGIGGVDLGFDRSGMHCKWQVEWDDYATKVLEKHWPKVERFKDVREFEPEERHRVDVVSGGFPCQDISNAANNRKGIDGERSGLWGEMLRIIERTRPTVVFAENVAVLRSRGLGRVLQQLSDRGYVCEWATLRASDFGYAHRRSRMFLVAYTNSIYGDCRGRNERFNAVGTRSAFNAEARSCKDAGDFQRRLVEAYGTFGFSPHDPATRGRVDGIPYRVDRLRGLGNAVVPRIAEAIGRRIVSLLQ
jgi:DNA (cytosine-5)-methyltransferase 1